jgi:hypothetical protein
MPLCDACGDEYFASCHDCAGQLRLIIITLNQILGDLPANEKTQRVRELMISFKEHCDARFLKPKERK